MMVSKVKKNSIRTKSKTTLSAILKLQLQLNLTATLKLRLKRHCLTPVILNLLLYDTLAAAT